MMILFSRSSSCLYYNVNKVLILQLCLLFLKVVSSAFPVLWFLETRSEWDVSAPSSSLLLAGSSSHVSAVSAAPRLELSHSLTACPWCLFSRTAEMLRFWFEVAVVLWLVPGCVGAAARLYTEEDPLVILSSSSLKSTVSNSSSAWLVQFFSSWCGHCIHYSSTWKALAQDVKGTAANTLGSVPL